MERKIVLTGIIKCKDEYLLVQRSKDDDFLAGAWEFPGGNIEDGEVIIEALKREIFEEIGVTIDTKKAKLVNYYDKIKEKDRKYHYIELDFLIKTRTKNLKIKLSNEHDNYCWAKKDSELIDDFIKAKIDSL